jgi:hypothetical protein
LGVIEVLSAGTEAGETRILFGGTYWRSPMIVQLPSLAL